MAALFELTLTQEELAFLLRLFKFSSFPGLPEAWLDGLSEREMTLALGAGERSLRARNLLTINREANEPASTVETLVAALIGAVLKTRVGLVVNRLADNGGGAQIVCITDTISVSYAPENGLFHFYAYENSRASAESVWEMLSGQVSIREQPERHEFSAAMPAMLVARLGAVSTDERGFQQALRDFNIDVTTVEELMEIFGHSFLASGIVGIWAIPEGYSDLRTIWLVQTAQGWWQLLPQGETPDYRIIPVSESDLTASLNHIIGFASET
jgi:hypothetical protein